MKVLTLLAAALLSVSAQNNKFPDDFLLGFASSAYQVEGAWNEDGKGEHVWDRLVHDRNEMIFDRSNADIADDSYHRYKEDVQLLVAMKAQVYRFSIAWSRLLPTGYANKINPLGLAYYNNLINELLDNNIQPMVTLFHWDLPQPLQDIGGWPNPLLLNYFKDYAKVAFDNFGDRVKWWITFNEPLQTCFDGYGGLGMAPALNQSGTADYLCTHTVIRSHAAVYRMYDAEYRNTQNGKVGISLDGGHFEPKNSSLPEDIEAAERRYQFEIGWFANPIFGNGDYPDVMRKAVDANSAAGGWPASRMPTFTPEEIEMNKGSADFFGVNHYTTYQVAPFQTLPDTRPDPSWLLDSNSETSFDPSWPTSASWWLVVFPPGIRRHVNWVKKQFGDIPIVITENGFSDRGTKTDTDRINYYNLYLHQLLEAVHTDKVNVIGYTAWSFMDNFEWLRGYSERFGLYQVDYDSPNRTRTAKDSAKWFTELYTTRTMPEIPPSSNL